MQRMETYLCSGGRRRRRWRGGCFILFPGVASLSFGLFFFCRCEMVAPPSFFPSLLCLFAFVFGKKAFGLVGPKLSRVLYSGSAPVFALVFLRLSGFFFLVFACVSLFLLLFSSPVCSFFASGFRVQFPSVLPLSFPLFFPSVFSLFFPPLFVLCFFCFRSLTLSVFLLGSSFVSVQFVPRFSPIRPPHVHGLSLAFIAREQNRFFKPSIVIIAGVMAMHRWTSVFLVWWTDEDDGFSLKRRRLIVNGHLCFGPWSFVLLQSDPWLKCN